MDQAQGQPRRSSNEQKQAGLHVSETLPGDTDGYNLPPRWGGGICPADQLSAASFKAHAGEQPSFNTTQANNEKTALSLNGAQGLMQRARGWEPQVSLGRA